METGLNASHMACPHFELFEGNQAFNADGDDTWGGAVYNTFFRNHLTGRRASFDDRRNRRAAGLMRGHYFYSFVGNVLGERPGMSMPGRLWARLFGPASWRLGYTPGRWRADVDTRVVETVFRHGNFDAATGAVEWAAGYDTDLPASLYLDEKPAFFGDAPWPWVDPAGTLKVHSLPARARFDAGRPIP